MREETIHQSPVVNVDVSVCGDLIAVSDIYGRLAIHSNQEIIRPWWRYPDIDNLNRGRMKLKFSSDGEMLAIATTQGTYIRNTETWDMIWYGPYFIRSCLQFTERDTRLVVSENNYRSVSVREKKSTHSDSYPQAAVGLNLRGVWFYDPETRLSKFFRSNLPARPIDHVSISPDSSRLVLAQPDQFEVIDVHSELSLYSRPFKRNTGCLDMAVSPNGKMIAIADAEYGATVHCLQTGEELLNFFVNRDPVMSVCFTADSLCVVGGYHSGTMRIWDL